MKSDKASSTEVKAETYCRHGFHEWLELVIPSKEPGEVEKTPSSATKYKCKHCGIIRSIPKHD